MFRKAVCLLWISTSFYSLFAQDAYDLASMFQAPSFQVGDTWMCSFQENINFTVRQPEVAEPQKGTMGSESVYTQKVTAVDEYGNIDEIIRFYRASETIIPNVGPMPNTYERKFVVYRREGEAWNITAYVVEDEVRHEVELHEADLDELAATLPDDAVGNYEEAMKLFPTGPVEIGDSWKLEMATASGALPLAIPDDFVLNKEKSLLTVSLVEVTDTYVRLSFKGTLVMSGLDEKAHLEMNTRMDIDSILVSYRRENFFELAMKAVTKTVVLGKVTDEESEKEMVSSLSTVRVKKVVFPVR